MKRHLAFLGVAAMLAFGLVAGRAATPAGTVGACSYYFEATKSVIVSSSSMQLWLQSFNNGCGYRYYRAQAQNRNANYSASVNLAIRVWACGTYKEGISGGWLSLPPYASVSFYSHAWYYGSCGKQADNYNTYVQTQYGNVS